ncbi:hypothetical protein [Dictyobacter halimunensis]|uniref:hypothetical protein n=1 Tax=Dictyobacter halimunensis TaxID=3026934 RepID=UPI0030C6AAAE
MTRFAYEAQEAIQAHPAALFAETHPAEKPQEAREEETFAGPAPTALPIVLSKPEREELEPNSRHNTTGSEKKAGNNATFVDSINVVPINGSVPRTRMQPPCTSRTVGFTWATTPITLSLGANVVSF